MVGELKKGRYIYYHCTGFKGKCGEPYVREEVLQEKLTALMGQLRFNESILASITHALQASHDQQQSDHNAEITRLRTECDRLQTMYVDKLDGKIDDDLYGRLSAEWGDQLRDLQQELAFHRTADRTYLEDGILLLRLAQNAQKAFAEKAAA